MPDPFFGFPELVIRRLTARARVLPDVFVLGVQKGGTSSLFAYLKMHPSYVAPYGKEHHFLQDQAEVPAFFLSGARGKKWYALPTRWYLSARRPRAESYRTLFPARRTMERVERRTGSRAITGEHTPTYLYCESVAKRIVAMSLRPKLVILLRDPVKRAFSDWQDLRNTEPEWERRSSFEQAVRDELDGKVTDFYLRYLYQGIYAPHLRVWFKYFDRDAFFITPSEALFKEAPATMNRIFSFLGMAPFTLDKLPVVNAGEYRQTLGPDLESELRTYFRPHNQDLYDLLSVDFGWK